MVCNPIVLILANNALFVSGQRIAYWCHCRPTNKAGFFIELFMSKDPAFLFYYENFSHGTKRYSFEEKGAYLDLLIEQADKYILTDNTIKDILGLKYDVLWPVLKEKFKTDKENNYFNKRLREEQEKRRKYSESRRINRTKSRIKPKKDMINISKTYVEHMEDENENENKDAIINKNRNKVFIKPTLNEVSDYITENNYTVKAEKWYSYYESNGWRVGKNPMKDWKAAVRTWAHNDFEKTKKIGLVD